jgi:hypothetical protein
MTPTHSASTPGREHPGAADRVAAVTTLVDRAGRDAHFRTALRRDPEAAARSIGLQLTSAEWAGLASFVA